MLDDFLVRAALASLAIALAAAPLGCFVVWRRMAYFGDATAHAAILGVALALATSISISLGVLLTALAMGLGVAAIAGPSAGLGVGGAGLDARGAARPAPDTLLGVFSHGALALGLVATALIPGRQRDLAAFLFGDILAVGRADLAVIWGGAALIIALIAWRWNRLLTATLHGDLARAAGIDPGREQMVLVIALAGLVAVALKLVGVLLITAMLIIPAAAARPLVRSPEAMAFLAAALGCVASLGGLGVAFLLDTPAGPTVVAVATLIFALSQALVRLLPAGLVR
ncbi:MAG: metal ABC transporter permease [Pseudomonadota bacterium]